MQYIPSIDAYIHRVVAHKEPSKSAHKGNRSEARLRREVTRLSLHFTRNFTLALGSKYLVPGPCIGAAASRRRECSQQSRKYPLTIQLQAACLLLCYDSSRGVSVFVASALQHHVGTRKRRPGSRACASSTGRHPNDGRDSGRRTFYRPVLQPSSIQFLTTLPSLLFPDRPPHNLRTRLSHSPTAVPTTTHHRSNTSPIPRAGHEDQHTTPQRVPGTRRYRVSRPVSAPRPVGDALASGRARRAGAPVPELARHACAAGGDEEGRERAVSISSIVSRDRRSGRRFALTHCRSMQAQRPLARAGRVLDPEVEGAGGQGVVGN